MTALLRGLKDRVSDLAAVVTVADDGGSSGRLRRAFDIPPPGDIRNCLVALSDADPIVAELFQYRFDDSVLKGHSFGNLFIAVLTELSGDFRMAIERARALLMVQGQVIPSTERKVVLVAEHPDGSKSTGEQAISRAGKRVTDIDLVPTPPPISEEIAMLIGDADLVCLGPGSLYTSIVPNLLVPGMVTRLSEARAPVIYVANLMTQPGETDDMSLEEHVDALLAIDGELRIDAVLVSSDGLPDDVLRRYARENSDRLHLDPDVDTVAGIPVIRADLVAPGAQIRHDPERLADALSKLLERDAEDNA